MSHARAGVIAIGMISALGLAGCTGGATAPWAVPPGHLNSQRSVSAPSVLPSGRSSVPVPPQGSPQGIDGSDGMSASDWNAIDQTISDSGSDLSQSDNDATYDAQGDTNP